MSDDEKPKIIVTCKCGNTIEVSVPDVEMFFNVVLAQIIIIADDSSKRICPKCGLTWAPRFKNNIPLSELFNYIEWVAFQYKPSIAPPSLGDVRRFG